MDTFIDDDAGYLRWLDANPNGYVLNTTRRPSPDYLVLHNASCGQLRRQDPRQDSFTHDYMKVCAPRVSELEMWAGFNLPSAAEITWCGHCHRDGSG